eukprot:363309-Chlamydomonas_euryale.AAC.3
MSAACAFFVASAPKKCVSTTSVNVSSLSPDRTCAQRGVPWRGLGWVRFGRRGRCARAGSSGVGRSTAELCVMLDRWMDG